MGRERRICIIRSIDKVPHDKSKLCFGFEYEPEYKFLETYDVLDAENIKNICPKCAWFYNNRSKARLLDFEDTYKDDEYEVCLHETCLTLKTSSDWWIGTHLKFCGTTDYHYSQEVCLYTTMKLEELEEIYEKILKQGSPIRPSDIDLFEESKFIMNQIRKIMKTEENLIILICTERP